MKATNPDPQKVLFSFFTRLLDILDHAHPMVKQSEQIEWSRFDESFEPMFCVDNTASRRSSTALRPRNFVPATPGRHETIRKPSAEQNCCKIAVWRVI
ncbi:MAG: hypothetical protein WC975_13775 [Phycisphaerae bacterium]